MKKKYSLLLFLVLLHIAFWIIKKPPQPSSDDLVYVLNAKSLIAGDYHLADSPKNHRLVVFAPVAFLIKLFGESPWVISSWPLLCSCIMLCVLFFFLEKYSGLTHAFAAGLLLASNTLQIDYSDSLFPDVIVAMFAFLYCLQIFKGRIANGNHWKYAVIASALFYLGFLAKEIIIFVLPFVFILMLTDISKRRNQTFWKKLVSAMALGGVLFVGIYYIVTGQINFLYHSVETRHSEFYVLNTAREIIQRITYGPAVMFAANPGYVILFLMTFFFFISQFWKRQAEGNDVILFFTFYFIILLLTYWFSPISFSHFAFIHLDPRMWMMLLIPMYILSGYVISKIIEGVNTYSIKLFTTIFLIVAVIAFIFISPQRALMFATFVLSSVLILLFKDRVVMNKLLAVLIMLLPSIVLAVRFTTANSNFLIP